ncbi:MAG: DUF1801 domain-containing protein, partial [Rhizobacter sp.]|nr:DUF1801 domain-containing protein [Rhizobacter sp.]
VVMRTIKWGNLVFMLNGVHAVAVVMHKEHANLQLFNGASLAESFRALQGSGKGLRHVKFGYRQAPDLALVSEVVCACVERLARERQA